MKKLIKSSALIAATMLAGSAFAQLQDEKNVTITMDLQPVLQLKMEGPDNIEFTFDEISEYYAGIAKYGATVLKVSSTVNWDLWAAGLSNGSVADLLWDNPVLYGNAFSGGLSANTVNTIPVTALELRQFPSNSSIGTCADLTATVGTAGTTNGSDYSLPFQPYTTNYATVLSANNIYAPSSTTPYLLPASTAVATTTEKYIKGAETTGAGCQGLGGSYLLQPNSSTLASTTPSAIGGAYYYVIDYRILPSLPVQFPAANEVTNTLMTTVPSYDAAYDAANPGAGAGAADLTLPTNYAAPGVYTMYVKYILAEDQ